MNTYAQYSAVFDAIRNNTISEIEAICQLQIAHEGQLNALLALRNLPPKFSDVKLSDLDPIENPEGIRVPAATKDDETRRVWVVMRARNTRAILVGLRSVQCNNPGTWGLMGGHPNVGEDAQEAARREFFEETNMDISGMKMNPLGFVRHKDVQHFFFAVEVKSPSHATNSGLATSTAEFDEFAFMSRTAIRLLVTNGKAHKSIKRFLDFLDKAPV